MQIDHYVEKVCAQAYSGVWKSLWTSEGQPSEGQPSECHRLKIVNAAYPNISDVCGALVEQGADIGVGWFIRGDGLMQFSLRSKDRASKDRASKDRASKDRASTTSPDSNIDVSRLAAEHGGGGHVHAAGFQLEAGAGLHLLYTWTTSNVRVENV